MNNQQLVTNLENLRDALNGDVLKGLPADQAMRVAGVQIEVIIRKVKERPPVNYYEYIESSVWKLRREAMIRLAGGRCQVCNAAKLLDTHHRSYAHLGYETSEDLIVLCRGCHQLFHESGRLAKPPKDESHAD